MANLAMGIVALPLRWLLLLLLLPTALFSTRVEFQTTVFSRDWARVRAPHYYANSPGPPALTPSAGAAASPASSSPGSVSADAQGSPWCNAGCIPNGSLTAESALLPTFRAPSLVQLMDGTILAISDERNGPATQLLAKASTDTGHTWSSARCIAGSTDASDPRPNADMPASVMDSVRGRVVTIHQSTHQRRGTDGGGDGGGSCGIRQLTSTDGRNWSASLCVVFTNPLPAHLNKALSPAPGRGLQLANGRLLFGIHSSFKQAMVIFSDDGTHWKTSTMPTTDNMSLPGSECQLASAHNGSVLLNCRPWPENTADADGRLVAVSNDGGLSFSPPWLDRRLWGADCADGFARESGGAERLFFSGPRNNNTQCPWCRTHMAVLGSDDDGETWSAPVSVWREEAAYSVLLGLRGGGMGLLYERGSVADHYHNITFALLAT